MLADQDGCISLFNPAAERLFGYQAAEFVGRNLDLLIPTQIRGPGRDSSFGATWRYEGRSLRAAPVEVEGRRKDGSYFSRRSGSQRDRNPRRQGSRQIQFLASIRDLTERNRIRAVLVQNEKLASIGLLSAGVAHEINNPLAFVANNLVVLERDSKGLLEVMDLPPEPAAAAGRDCPRGGRRDCSAGGGDRSHLCPRKRWPAAVANPRRR